MRRLKSILILAFIGITLTCPAKAGEHHSTVRYSGIYSDIDLEQNKPETSDKLELKIKPKTATTSEANTSWKVTDEEYHLLALVVEAEAGDQDLIGKRLVVDVILNRVASSKFPDSIHGVIFQRNQFSTTFDGAFDRVRRDGICGETYQAIDMELHLNESRYNTEVLFFTMGYYNPYCKPMFIWGTHYFGN